MPIPVSHVSEKTRTFSGEQDVASLIDWLNHTKNAEARERVLEIGKLVAQVAGWATLITGKDTATSEAWDKSPNVRRMETARRKLDKLLEKYTYTANFRVFAGRDGYFQAFFAPVGTAKVERYKGEVLLSEYGAIRSLLDSATTGSFWRVARCTCGQFFFQRFKHQHFHSSKCREKAFRSSPEWKEHRNQKAREYYWLHKSGKVK